MGDYAVGELSEELSKESVVKAVAKAYEKYAKGQTLIFATSVEQAEKIAEEIDDSVVITGSTKNREELINDFTNRKIKCLVNCMVFTEGTDLPLIETVMIARPTQSDSLYAQMVGRGLRLYEGKEYLTLIDLVGVTGKRELCTAPSLLGIDMSNVPKDMQDKIEGDLFELPNKINELSDNPENWVLNSKIVDLWANYSKYNTYGVNYFKLPNGNLVVSLKGGKIEIPVEDELRIYVPRRA